MSFQVSANIAMSFQVSADSVVSFQVSDDMVVSFQVSADIQDTVGRLCSELKNSDIQLSTTPDAMSLTMGTATFELYMATKDLYK